MTTEEERIQLARQMMRLAEDKTFQELILERFIEKGILDITLTSDVSNTAVQDALKARKILKDYIRDTIAEGEILLEQLNEEGK